MQAMAEVMAKSKAFKAAKQAQQDKDQGEMERLDAAYTSLLQVSAAGYHEHAQAWSKWSRSCMVIQHWTCWCAPRVQYAQQPCVRKGASARPCWPYVCSSKPGHGVERHGCTIQRGTHETQTVSEPCAHILDPPSHRWRTS